MYIPITLVFDRFVPTQFARFVGDRVRSSTPRSTKTPPWTRSSNRSSSSWPAPRTWPRTRCASPSAPRTNIIDTQAATTEAFRNLLAWVAGVSLIVGGIGIMNIMLVSVTERTREIGIRQSVGATPNDIRLQFLTEALLLSLVGGLIGVVAGVGGALIFGATSDMRTVIVPSSILLAFGSAAAVGIFFGYFPANKAAQLDPIEALRHE